MAEPGLAEPMVKPGFTPVVFWRTLNVSSAPSRRSRLEPEFSVTLAPAPATDVRPAVKLMPRIGSSMYFPASAVSGGFVYCAGNGLYAGLGVVTIPGISGADFISAAEGELCTNGPVYTDCFGLKA